VDKYRPEGRKEGIKENKGKIYKENI